MKAAPAQTVEPGGNRGFDDAAVVAPHRRRHRSVIGRAIIDRRAELQIHLGPMRKEPGMLHSRLKRERGLSATDINAARTDEFPHCSQGNRLGLLPFWLKQGVDDGGTQDGAQSRAKEPHRKIRPEGRFGPEKTRGQKDLLKTPVSYTHLTLPTNRE